jgi:hypothetical protein
MGKQANTAAVAAAAKAKAAEQARIAKAAVSLVAAKPGETLESVRKDFATASTKSYGATGRYANLLTATYGAGWEKVELPNKAGGLTAGDNMQAAIFGERAALGDVIRAECILKGVTANPSVYWTRIKQYVTALEAAAEKAAKAEALAKATPEEKAKAESDAAAQKVKDLRERALDTLTALRAAMAKAGSLSDDMAQCQGQIDKAIKAINPTWSAPIIKTAK